MSDRFALELLAPARNLELGRAAIDYGADAVYIGGPAFGARAAAGNSIADITQLAEYAHRFSARVYAALNTILYDHELEDAVRLAWAFYEAGVDALIVQDMGLLLQDMPPLALHASTQVDNRSPEKVHFLEQVGFSQVVLARELSLTEVAAIARASKVRLEYFVHGALCVSYSGQCYMSQARTQRSANRGECAQLCRLPCDLKTQDGQILAENQHLLSLKDLNQGAHLRELVLAGVSAFKIEGRLKDITYVKNVTAWYRQALDQVLDTLPDYHAAAEGHCQFTFVPQPEKTFNRGMTDFFLETRQADIASMRTPKFAGEPVGAVRSKVGRCIEVTSAVTFNNGDGLSYFDAHGALCGVRVNRVEGSRLHLAEAAADLQAGTPLYRNLDQAFDKVLNQPSAERRIPVWLSLRECAEGLQLHIRDAAGITACATAVLSLEAARDAERALATIREQLARLGNTPFMAADVTIEAAAAVWFVPVGVLNQLRRDACEALMAARAAAWRCQPRVSAVEPPVPYPVTQLTYLGNVANQAARAFYAQHGVVQMVAAFEVAPPSGEVVLMQTKHCLRYSFNLCPKQDKGNRPKPLLLSMGKHQYTLRFDCKRCEMQVLGTAQAD